MLLWSETQTKLVSKISIALFVHSWCRSRVVQENHTKEKSRIAHRHLWKKECELGFHVQGHVTTAVEGD